MSTMTRHFGKVRSQMIVRITAVVAWVQHTFSVQKKHKPVFKKPFVHFEVFWGLEVLVKTNCNLINQCVVPSYSQRTHSCKFRTTFSLKCENKVICLCITMFFGSLIKSELMVYQQGTHKHLLFIVLSAHETCVVSLLLFSLLAMQRATGRGTWGLKVYCTL